MLSMQEFTYVNSNDDDAVLNITPGKLLPFICTKKVWKYKKI